jgi:hypothetical protein
MYNNYHRSVLRKENNASLFRLNEDLEYENILDYKFRVSGCICFPADGRPYFSPGLLPLAKVYAFDYPKERAAGGKSSGLD